MARFDERSGNLYVTELGRVASHYYIRHASILTYNELLKPHMNEADVLAMIARSSGAWVLPPGGLCRCCRGGLPWGPLLPGGCPGGLCWRCRGPPGKACRLDGFHEGCVLPLIPTRG